MVKRLFIAVIIFTNSIIGNLTASWFQKDIENFLGSYRLAGAAGGAVLTIVAVCLLETPHVLAINWRWHRFWYLLSILLDQDFRQWESKFAQLESVTKKFALLRPEVVAGGQRMDLVKVLTDVLMKKGNSPNRVLVLGEPGSGKTTGLERLVQVLAKQGVWRLGFGQRVPVFVRLGNYQDGSLLNYVAQTILHSVKGRSAKVLSKGIEELVEHGHVILVLDALDEALGARRELVLAELSNFLRSRAFLKVPVIISSNQWC